MQRNIKILLLYKDSTGNEWVEHSIRTERREIPVENIYDLLPNKLKTEDLCKIVRLGFDGCWRSIEMGQAEGYM